MVRRKNTAEAYEILLRIAQKNEEETKRAQELSSARKKSPSAGLASGRKRPSLAGEEAGSGPVMRFPRRSPLSLRRPVDEVSALARPRPGQIARGEDDSLERGEWLAGVAAPKAPPPTQEPAVRRRMRRPAESARAGPRTRPRGDVAVRAGEEAPIDWRRGEDDRPEAPSGPEARQRDAASSKSGSPEAASPEAASPEAASPEAATPEAATPEAASPEAASPEAAS
ncbi:MAG: hypothetical protein O7J95_09670, partial [Planctomycetota bacterium]|nr:hypothetical protein [Planctomycetota bacterium]